MTALKKKKILIVAHAMRLGGVETSLLGLLECFDYSKYKVDLFLYLHDGEFLPYIPKQVNLIPQNKHYASLLLPFSKNTFSIKVLKIIAKIYAFVFCKFHKIKGENFVYLLNMHRYAHIALPKISNNVYHLAISFLTPHYTVANKVNAKQKVAWIHTDYSQYGLDVHNELKMWSKFNKIASISADSTVAFVNKFKALKNKVLLIENILPKEFVITRSNAFQVNFDQNNINLCSVGRFTYPKNFDAIPQLTRMLLDSGLDVQWYIIGYGGDENLIKQKIQTYKVEDNVIILGKKSNPYPYIKACDIYVQPSRYEGKAVTVREAQMLAKPVVITNFPSSGSQLINNLDGVVIPLETEKCALALKEFILDKEKQKTLIENCSNADFSNQDEINKIYQLVAQETND